MNCFVHVVMYSYYLMANIRPQYKKNIWWKMYVTQLQMVTTNCITPLSVQEIPSQVHQSKLYSWLWAFVQGQNNILKKYLSNIIAPVQYHHNVTKSAALTFWKGQFKTPILTTNIQKYRVVVGMKDELETIWNEWSTSNRGTTGNLPEITEKVQKRLQSTEEETKNSNVIRTEHKSRELPLH